MSMFDIFSNKSSKIEVPDDVLTSLADGEMIDITTVSGETFATKPPQCSSSPILAKRKSSLRIMVRYIQGIS